MMSVETIVAVATPPGRGGVGVVRVSGPQAQTLALHVTQRTTITPRYAHYTPFYGIDKTPLDHGVLLYFKAPHSFTGEDVIEFQCHGSPVVLDLMVQTCVALGARVAKPGEFSERAFLNDKIDLTQAEAIADLIDAHSVTAAKLAMRSLQGDFSKHVHRLNEQLVRLRLFVEASIDFSDEDLDFLNDGHVAKGLLALQSTLRDIRASASQGVMLQEGLTFVLAGRPNAGKSTLMNQLAGCDVAIVTAIAGTTRDVMRQTILLDDIPVQLLDTAGLRESEDVIEQEGIKRAWNELQQADGVLLIQDVNEVDPRQEEVILSRLPSTVPVIKVWNKIDRLDLGPKIENNMVYISAHLGLGLDLLKEQMKALVGVQPSEGRFLARRRHLQALDEAAGFLDAGYTQLMQHRAGELLAEDLRQAHQCLCSITGEFTSDDLLGSIFSHFCIGK